MRLRGEMMRNVPRDACVYYYSNHWTSDSMSNKYRKVCIFSCPDANQDIFEMDGNQSPEIVQRPGVYSESAHTVEWFKMATVHPIS